MANPLTPEEHAGKISEIAAEVAMRYFRGALGVEFKADESPVTQADKHVESAVRAYISQHFPDHGVFGEEQGIADGDGRHMWVIDPIDGTRSFLSGYPTFGFLLAHLIDGKPRLGVIGMPALNETYIGADAGGAKMNGEPIHVSRETLPERAVLYVNEGDKIFRDHPEVFARLMQTGQTRRFAYDCYPHALLAAGHVDAVIDYDLQPYDFLAASAVVTAAGGIMTDWQGKALTLDSGGEVISAATPELHSGLLEILNAAPRRETP